MSIKDLYNKSAESKGYSITKTNGSSELTSNDKFAEIQSNVTQSLTELSEKMLSAVRSGDIEFTSTADIKNVISAIQMFKQDANSVSDTTPQISADLANFYSYELHLPEGTPVTSNDITQQLIDKTPEEIAEMVAKREAISNEENAKNM